MLANRPFPILCVIGNHEPILGMMKDGDIPEADIGIGEKVWVVKKENEFDYVISHTGPSIINRTVTFKDCAVGSKESYGVLTHHSRLSNNLRKF